MRNLIASFLALATLAPASASARVRAVFTSNGEDVPAAITSAFQAAERRAIEGRPAQIDVAVFSFTHWGIADELVRVVAEQPEVQARVILDLSQLSHNENHIGPYLEDLKAGKYNDACKLRMPGSTTAERAPCKAALEAQLGGVTLDNLAVKYKWYDGYAWDTNLDRPVLSHTKSLLMHRKIAVVNGDTLLAGSFNWSPQAAGKNFENLMILSGTAERPVVDQYIAEFEAMWTDEANFKSGDECRELRQVIWDRLYEENE